VDMEIRDAIRSVVVNIPGICKLKPEQEECLLNVLNGGEREVIALCDWPLGNK